MPLNSTHTRHEIKMCEKFGDMQPVRESLHPHPSLFCQRRTASAGAAPSSLTQIAPPPGSGLSGWLFFPTDYLDGWSDSFKQRVIQTVSFHSPTQNSHRRTQGCDSLCLDEREREKNNLLTIVELGGPGGRLEQEVAEISTSGCGWRRGSLAPSHTPSRRTHRNTHLNVQDIVQVFPQQYGIWLGQINEARWTVCILPFHWSRHPLLPLTPASPHSNQPSLLSLVPPHCTHLESTL